MRRSTGLTLVEVLVATAAMGLVLGAAMAGWHLASSAYQEASTSAPAFRMTADGMDALTTDLRACQHIYAPQQNGWKDGWFSPSEAAPFVFARATEHGPEVVAFAQKAGGGLERWTRPTAEAPFPVDRSTLRTFAAGSTRLSLSWSQDAAGHDFIKVELWSSHEDPIETRVRMLGAYPAEEVMP